MAIQKYWRLVTELRDRGRSAVEAGDPVKRFELLLCGLKMLEAADEFERLLRTIQTEEDDRR